MVRGPHHLFPEPLKHRYHGMMETATALLLIFPCRDENICCEDSLSTITGERQEAAPCCGRYRAPYYSHYGNTFDRCEGKKNEHIQST